MTTDKFQLLNGINDATDVRALPRDALPQLCAEVRSCLIDTVSKTAGHLASGLGVVELTVALHYVYDTPKDIIVWDVGHQAYPHKIRPFVRRTDCTPLFGVVKPHMISSVQAMLRLRWARP